MSGAGGKGKGKGKGKSFINFDLSVKKQRSKAQQAEFEREIDAKNAARIARTPPHLSLSHTQRSVCVCV